MIRYDVPSNWNDGFYRDDVSCCSAARPFSIVHDTPSDECWLLIHGYRGYPGEMVRPAIDLYEAGFDVYVPRLPGHGTSGRCFVKSKAKDWVGLAQNALDDLKNRYSKVHLLGHSMGSAIVAIIGCADSCVGKIVYVSPSFTNTMMPPSARFKLAFMSLFTSRLKCGWHQDSRFRMHYENAPCDDLFLGSEYWQYWFTRQLHHYWRVMMRAIECMKSHPHESLAVCPMCDKSISIPSTEIYRKALGDKANVAEIENGTHCVLYDKDPNAEDAAVKAVIGFALL